MGIPITGNGTRHNLRKRPKQNGVEQSTWEGVKGNEHKEVHLTWEKKG